MADSFDIIDMKAAFDAGMEYETYLNRGTSTDQSPGSFEEWFNRYQ